MVIKVTTEQLRTAAYEASGYIKRVYESFDNIESIIKATSGYWEGEGQAAFLKSYLDRIGKIDKALMGFQDNIDDLLKIAGIYETTESRITDNNSALWSDVIV